MILRPKVSKDRRRSNGPRKFPAANGSRLFAEEPGPADRAGAGKHGDGQQPFADEAERELACTRGVCEGPDVKVPGHGVRAPSARTRP
jgi:hypothetical protein